MPDSQLLAGLFESEPRTIWRDEDLAAVFRHQMSAAVTVEIAGVEPAGAAKFAMLCASRELLLKSFSDLLTHPNPPLELLQMTKRFAKAMCNHPDAPLPAPVAYVLYYAAIAAAMVRCGQKISVLNDADVIGGLQWSMSRPWIDDPTRELFKAALESMPSAGGENP